MKHDCCPHCGGIICIGRENPDRCTVRVLAEAEQAVAAMRVQLGVAEMTAEEFERAMA